MICVNAYNARPGVMLLLKRCRSGENTVKQIFRNSVKKSYIAEKKLARTSQKRIIRPPRSKRSGESKQRLSALRVISRVATT